VKTLLTLLIGALIGAVLAVTGLAAVTRVLNPSAADVAHKVSNDTGYDPAAPPAFYGTR
jgi:dsRNA-specific ribonuclease